ncbi:MAG: TetR family transcriptional regulator [Thermoanaerobaculales bacterium]|jgi:AcrR family transcriptional regulator|nr:TetR family transcriptional regulator [Thermoanaerobaculales bacterium]
MGKLIDPQRSRKAKEAREERARRILQAAHVAFTRHPYSEVDLDAIGREAGVKQGQANFAFRSREELFMHVLRARLNEWYELLEGRFSGEHPPATKDETADAIARSLAEMPDLTKVLGGLHTALELHEDGMEVHRFYHYLRTRLLELADLVQRQVEGVHQWDAFDALYRGLVVAAAVHPLHRPVGNLAVDLVTEDHQVFALDLEDEVSRAVRASLGR